MFLLPALIFASVIKYDSFDSSRNDDGDNNRSIFDAVANTIGSISRNSNNIDTNGDLWTLLLSFRSFKNNDSLSGGNTDEHGTSINTAFLDADADANGDYDSSIDITSLDSDIDPSLQPFCFFDTNNSVSISVASTNSAFFEDSLWKWYVFLFLQNHNIYFYLLMSS